jgi:hypothetical protein
VLFRSQGLLFLREELQGSSAMSRPIHKRTHQGVRRHAKGPRLNGEGGGFVVASLRRRRALGSCTPCLRDAQVKWAWAHTPELPLSTRAERPADDPCVRLRLQRTPSEPHWKGLMDGDERTPSARILPISVRGPFSSNQQLRPILKPLCSDAL